jgi:rod shape-determining protein MreC
MVVDHRFDHLQVLRSGLSLLTYPLYYIADLPKTTSDWLVETTASHQQLSEQNKQLQKDKILLEVRLQKLEALEAENLRLRNLLDSSFKVGERVLIAELISVDLDPYKHQVIINKGTRSGVFVSQPVLDAHAVMGQVIHTSPMNSTVLLITDASHALPVQVLRNGLRSVAVGTGEINLLQLPFLPRNADIQVGDKLVTSGLGGIFPPGYPVAEVTRVSQEPGQHFASIEATPLAHLDRSREVLLVWTIRPETRLAENTGDTEKTEQTATTEEPTKAEVSASAEPETPTAAAVVSPQEAAANE